MCHVTCPINFQDYKGNTNTMLQLTETILVIKCLFLFEYVLCSPLVVTSARCEESFLLTSVSKRRKTADVEFKAN